MAAGNGVSPPQGVETSRLDGKVAVLTGSGMRKLVNNSLSSD